MEDATVTIVDVHSVGTDAIAIEFDTPADFEARPGQFVKLTAELDGENESRFYTISSPDVTDTFDVTIEIDPEGTLGPYLGSLEAGDQLTVSGPYGNAYYEDESRVVILAGGPGVGPAIGIARRAIADGGDAAIVYQDDEPIHKDELASLENDGATISVLGSDDDMTDAVANVISGDGNDNSDDKQVFIYGFADFLDAATSAIDAAGADSDQAKVENFG